MKIVVMGGSFNPPTIAHLKMMRSALNQLGAEKDFFVPTADKSVRRKMRRAGFPEAELYFLIGSDNMENYTGAFRLVEFLEKYRYAVVDRGDGDLDAILREIPAAWERRDRFCYVTPPEGIENISSTLIREKVRNNEPGLKELLHPCVMDMIRRDNRC